MMMMPKNVPGSFSLHLALLTAMIVLAACGSGGITGHVTNADGDPLSGGAVRLEVCADANCKTAYSLTTSTEGDYAFEGVELGRYTLVAEWADAKTCSGVPLITREGLRIDAVTTKAGRSSVVGQREIDYVSREQSFRVDLEFPCR